MPSIFSYIRLLILFFVPFTLNAQFVWGVGEGGMGLDLGRNLRIDHKNNIILSGDIAGSPAFRGTYYEGNGLSDGFVGKYDDNANLQWLRLIGGTGVDKCFGTVIDASDNIYLCGSFQNSMTVGSFTLQSNGGTDLFVLKLSASNEVLWLKSFGGTLDDVAYSIGVNNNNDVFICGTFGGSIAFGDTVLTATSIVQSYIAKLSSSGNPQWAINAVSSSNNTINSLTVLPDGNVVTAGYYSFNVSIDSFSLNSSSASYDVFLCKLNDEGKPQWLVKAGGSYDDMTTAICSDLEGNISICGYFSGSSVFGSYQLYNAGYNDPFIAHYSGNGECLWARSGAGLSLDLANGIACDAQGNIYATGMYGSNISFSEHTISGYNDRQIFVVSYNANGDFRWLQDAGENGTDCGMAISTDVAGNVYITGYYTYRCAFDDIFLPLAQSPQDIFMAKYTQPVSGIQEAETDKLSIYPNPATDFITVSGAKNGMKIRIANLLGEIVSETTLQHETQKIGVAHLVSGAYFVNNRLFIKQ